MEARYLTRTQAAALLGVSSTTFWRLEKSGQVVPVLTIGSRKRYDERLLVKGANNVSPPGRPAADSAAREDHQ